MSDGRRAGRPWAFNRTGVTVTNDAGQQFVVGGDGHMLSIQSEESIGVALEANTLAAQAISDFLSTGATKVEVEDICCLGHIFPSMALSTKYRVVRAAGPKLVGDGKF